MRKKMVIVMLMTCMFLSILPGTQSAAAAEDELRGVWIATVYNIDFPSKQGLTRERQKQELDTILSTAQQAGLNAVFFQVRPTADALYQSAIFPWSAVLTGTQGKVNDKEFDPLAYLVEQGKEKGIDIHAWINPLRITTGSVASPQVDVSRLASGHPARSNPSYSVASGGMLYFDPGIPAVRKLIVDGAVEIVKNYEVAGIHFDDYFYPTSGFDDSRSYQAYGAGYGNRSDWRRANIDALIQEVRDGVKAADPTVSFGVSPFAIWADQSKNPLGSDTRGGLSTYYDHYADTRKWVKEGMVDYICPQIYWSIGYPNADFKILLDWWSEVCRGTNVKLYAGHAVYKVGDAAQGDKWMAPGEIPGQLALVQANPVAQGSIFYGWSKLKGDTLGVAAAISAFYGGQVGVPVMDVYPMPAPPESKNLIIAAPTSGYKTNGKNISILGSCDPRFPLYFEGKQVTVTENGHFSVFPELKVGENVFSFVHQGKTTTFKVVRNKVATGSGSSSGGSSGGSSASGGDSYVMRKAEFKPGSLYPVTNVIRRAGQAITFGCTAPAGAKVWVEVGLYKVSLTRQSNIPAVPALTAAKFTGDLTFPTLKSSEQFTLLGKPTFIMEYQGRRITSTPGNTVSVQAAGDPRYATVIVASAITRTGPSKSYGTLEPLDKGAVDRIYGEQNGYYLLRSGMWVAMSDVRVTEGQGLPVTTLSQVTATQRDRHTELAFHLNTNTPYALSIKDGVITLKIFNTKGVPFTMPSSPLIATVGYEALASHDCVYTLKLGQDYYGHSISYTDQGIVLSLKNPPSISADQAAPLKNAKILLDAGHGGSDPGAIGPMGKYGPNESHVNLAISLYARDYLRSRGATVITTRETDVRVTLEERSAAIRAQRPDISVSIHANSLAYETNYNNTTGMMTYYTKDFSKSAAAFIQNELISTLGRVDKNARQQNLAVCRIDEVPAILIETGFMSSPAEYEWLADTAKQKEIGIAIGKAIEKWMMEKGVAQQ